MAKLTLSVDSQVISRAKQHAKTQGISVSAMVEAYLTAIAEQQSVATDATPVLQSVRGVLKKADTGDYHEHLTAKNHGRAIRGL